MEAYIYTYVNKETGKTYIGSRSRYKGSCYDDFNIKYFSSSKDKEFRQDMADGKLEGQIVLVMNDENANKKIVEVEHKMIDAYWNKYGKENSYNHYCNGAFSTSGLKKSDAAKEKIRKFRIGKALSEETRRKLSESHKGKKASDETRRKLSEQRKGHYGWNKGKKWSDETKEKIRKATTGEKNGFYGKHPKKYKWITPEGEIKEMCLCNAHKWHPDWKLIK